MIQAHEEEVQKLQRHHQSELAGQRSQIEGLQQSLVAKTQVTTLLLTTAMQLRCAST